MSLVQDLMMKIMKDGKVDMQSRIAKVAPQVVADIEKTATKLMSLTNLNRTVHLPTYNLLIGEEARKLYEVECAKDATGAAAAVQHEVQVAAV